MSNNNNTFAPALLRGDLSLVYQPIRPIASSPNDEANYFEALLRVKEVSPITFLGRLTAAENCQLDRWVAERVCKLPKQHRYAINLSPFSLCDRDFIQRLLNSDRRFVLEITEHHAISLAQTSWLIEVCRQIPVMLDDFGAAYSGLNRLCSFGFKGLKIDGQLALQLQKSDKARAIVGSLLRMAQELNVCCVCEYVETMPIWELLRELHAQYAPSLDLHVQGWAVGMPQTFDPKSRTFLEKVAHSQLA